MLNEDQRRYIERLESGEEDAALLERLVPAERPHVAIKEERVTIRLEEEIMDKIDNACERMGGTTRSTVIRWAIAEWIQRHPDLVAPLEDAGNRHPQPATT